MCGRLKLYFHCIVLQISVWVIADGFKHEHFHPTHVEQTVPRGLFSLRPLECEHLSASCSLSEGVYLQTSNMGGKLRPALLGSSLVSWKNQHPSERRTFFSTWIPHTKHIPNDDFLDSMPNSICLDLLYVWLHYPPKTACLVTPRLISHSADWSPPLIWSSHAPT